MGLTQMTPYFIELLYRQRGVIAVDGGDGDNFLSIYTDDISSQVTFMVSDNGNIVSNLGQFKSSSSFAFDFYRSNGDDVIQCGAGNDYLSCGLGADTMTGRGGADRFIFRGDYDFGTGTLDHITDFSHAEHDVIDLAQVDAVEHKRGNQYFAFIGDAAFDGQAGELRFTDNHDGTLTVQADTDGDRNADLQLLVTTAHPLVAGDFAL